MAVVSDLHVNSTVGLAPPYTELDDGGTYRPSKAQRWLWRNWLDFWEQVRAKKEEHNAQLRVVFNAEIADLNKHSKYQLFTVNETTVMRAAVEVLTPALDVADVVFVTRGTEAHTGGSAHIEEKIAEDIGAAKDDEAGNWSWWWLPMEAAGVRLDFQHHPATGSRRPWTRGAAPTRQAAIVAMEYALEGKAPPHLGVYSHGHYFADSGTTIRPRVIFTPPWQLTTAFGHRLGVGGRLEPVGGVAFVCQDGQYTMHDIRYQGRRRKPWKM